MISLTTSATGGHGGYTYLWSNNDTSSVVNVFAFTGTTFTVWGYGPNGCAGKVVLTPHTEECTGISKNDESALFEIYPNPNNGEFHIISRQPAVVNITDVSGKLVYSAGISDIEQKITLNGMSNGIYFITISNAGKSITKKLIIQ